MKHTQIQKTWIAGTGTLVITIPKSIKDLQYIEEGDYVEITIEKIQTKQTEELKNELKKTKPQKKETELDKLLPKPTKNKLKIE